MSSRPAPEPVAAVIDGRPRDLGGFSVQRLLPSVAQRVVGPFVFFDHFGPAHFVPGTGMDVRPHPHINLATVTYLFEGAMDHRDSLGSFQTVRPGELNWMTAGRGIVHSERTPAEERARGGNAHGLQLWVALPREHEEVEPSFEHHPATALPVIREPGLELRLIAGTAWGLTAPARTLSPLFYVDVGLETGAALALPEEHEQRAAYVISGAAACGGQRIERGRMAVFHPGARPTLKADERTRLVILGGEPLDGERHIWWNFVSSRPERIEQAKRDWAEGRFAKVPGDETEFIPLPD